MKPQPTIDKAALRREAEARLKLRTATHPPPNEMDLRRLQHELEVHQIELEMQNEELHAANAEIEAERERYTDLFDFAPAGYFTLTADGSIRQVNLTGALLLGIERAHLTGQRFGLLVAEGDRKVFTDFLARTFQTTKNETCELTLTPASRPPLVVRLEARRAPDGERCRVVLLDVTARRHAENQLRGKNTELAAALAQVKQLTGLLPICAGCKKIRNPTGEWQQMETYLSEHSEATFTHGYCPDCTRIYLYFPPQT